MTSRSQGLGKASSQAAETHYSLLCNSPTEESGTCHGCHWAPTSSVVATSGLAFHFTEIRLPA